MHILDASVGSPVLVDSSRVGSAGQSGPAECAALKDAVEGPLPLLASSCPGWVCYAEKTQGAAVLPHISSAKSPQAVQGTAVKRWLAPGLALAPESIYHCAVMMCYDKKLEAAREDLLLPGACSATEPALRGPWAPALALHVYVQPQ